MFGTKSSLVVCFVHRNRLQFFSGSTISTLEIPLTMIKNFDVVNRDELYVFVNQWLRQNTPGSDRLLFVLSTGSYFDSDIAGGEEAGQESEILKFYDTIPFEELITKVVLVGTSKHAFAVNKPYLVSLQHAFSLQGLHCIGVIPAYVLGTHGTKLALDAEMGNYIFKHLDTLLPYSIIDAQDAGVASTSITAEPIPGKPSNSRMLAMVGVFVVLVLILVVMLVMR